LGIYPAGNKQRAIVWLYLLLIERKDILLGDAVIKFCCRNDTVAILTKNLGEEQSTRDDIILFEGNLKRLFIVANICIKLLCRKYSVCLNIVNNSQYLIHIFVHGIHHQ